MSYCYVDNDTSDQASLQHHYLHLMPESPLQHKLPQINSPTTSHVRYVQRKKKRDRFSFPHVCAYVCVE